MSGQTVVIGKVRFALLAVYRPNNFLKNVQRCLVLNER